MLLPPAARRIGTPLALTGGVVLVLRHVFLIAPEWLEWPVFAVSSLFLKRRSFEMINNNVMDEWGAMLLLVGTVCVLFAREPVEDEQVAAARLSAFLAAAWAQAAAFGAVLLLTFGLDFFAGLLLSLPVFPVVYRVTFGRAMRRRRAT